jgi:4-amino-4-deoxychorismate lyase
VFIDESGFLGESSNMNLAFVTHDGVLRHPKFERVLAGCTSRRVLELAQGIVGRVLTGVEVCDIPVAAARAAREMVLLGSSVKVAPIVEWDGRPVGDGKPGPGAKALLELLEKDMREGDRLIDVPY